MPRSVFHHDGQLPASAWRFAAIVWLIPVLCWGADEKGTQAAPKFDAAAVKFFQEKVRPLLEARCFECHAGNSKRLEGGLRLDARPLVLKGGDSGAAAVPGKPADSLIVKAVNYDTFEMPPRGRLPQGEIDILTKWVELGLPWSDEGLKVNVEDKIFNIDALKKAHWSWQPIKDPAVPTVKQASWPQTDFDRFILAKIEEQGLKPSPEADRRTLVRRTYFDLIGLPPSPAEAAEFLNDPDPIEKAHAKLVDWLLASPHFGERWARHWLDLVRYGETLGHEFDYPLRNAFRYRDYVIRALNADVPYDQFVREQIAGDLLAKPRLNPEDGTNESLQGTGFWFLGELKHAPVDVKGEEAAVIDNQIDVFSKTFMALTVSCARCHDHKYDAISAKDYYALAGFIQSSHRQNAYLDPHGKVQQAADALQAIHAEATTAMKNSAAARQREQLAAYFNATREVVFGTPKPEDASKPATEAREPIVFADFEQADFGGWKAEGNAFAKGTVEGTLPAQQQVSGFSGKRLVNSYVNGDDATGTLTSPEFEIQRSKIRFLIGGGHWAAETCLNLMIDDKVVRSAVGSDNEKLDPAGWDVTEFQGRRARLQIVDRRTGGWGHVNVDHIVFTDDQVPVTVRRPVAVVAREFSVNPIMLQKWVEAVNSSSAKLPSHPFAAWRELANAASSRQDIATAREQLRARQARAEKRTAPFDEKTQLLADFNGETWKGWQATGWAFGTGPVRQGDWSRGEETVTPGVAHSGRYGNGLRGVLRSPTFTLSKPTLLYRIAGKGVTVRLIIEGYLMDEFTGLLFSGAKFDVGNENWQWHRQGGDVSRYQGHRCHIEIIDEGNGWVAVDEIRLADNDAQPPEPVSSTNNELAADESVASPASLTSRMVQLATNEHSELGNWLLNAGLIDNPQLATSLAAAAQKMKDVEAKLPEPLYAVGIMDGSSENEHLFIRGSHKNLGPEVPRRMLEALYGSNQPAPANGSGRLELAEKLLDPANPFPARVMANRIWQHLFGRGIVDSVDNFGVLGKPPTHPELLDALAIQFVRDGWSIKNMIRSVMLSRTYRMDSQVVPEFADRDPQNLWWHRMPIRRLEGEAIRDAMLVVSGRLDRTLSGPSVPVHLTPFMQGRGRPGSGPLDGAGRRSIYTSVNRNFLSPMMIAFDTPIPFTTVGRRNVSNVPAQALILMNDQFVLDQSRLWAKRVLAEQPADTTSRIQRLYEAAFTRAATEAEVNEGIEFLKSQAAAVGNGVNWQQDERVWADLCHVLFNVKEFVFLK